MGATQSNLAGAKGNRYAGPIRGVILDYGEVVCRQPTAEQLVRMAAAVGLDASSFRTRYDQDRLLYDRGDLSPRDYWSKLVPGTTELTEGLLSKLRQWDVEMWAEINPEITQWLASLRASGFKTALLSNMHSDMALYVRRNFAWLKSLDCAILSSEVRLVKPDPAIYQRCVEGLGLPASEALFIDDREVNVRAAASACMAALRFQSTESLRNDLAGLNFPVLPELR